jgi:hypothetical protein
MAELSVIFQKSRMQRAPASARCKFEDFRCLVQGVLKQPLPVVFFHYPADLWWVVQGGVYLQGAITDFSDFPLVSVTRSRLGLHPCHDLTQLIQRKWSV